MQTLRWTNEAVLGLASLSQKARQDLFERLDLVGRFPEMYPARQRGRFTGLRYFVVARRWIVYYRHAERDLLVFAIVPALARPR